MPRLPLSYFEAVVPLPDDWSSRRPCAYLLLSAPYEQSAAEARVRDWRVIEIHGVRHLAIAANLILITEGLLDAERLVGNRPSPPVTTGSPSSREASRGNRGRVQGSVPRQRGELRVASRRRSMPNDRPNASARDG